MHAPRRELEPRMSAPPAGANGVGLALHTVAGSELVPRNTSLVRMILHLTKGGLRYKGHLERRHIFEPVHPSFGCVAVSNSTSLDDIQYERCHSFPYQVLYQSFTSPPINPEMTTNFTTSKKD